MYRYLLALTGNPLDAEDLTQETFAAAVVGLARFQARSSVATWLLGIARHQWQMFVRKASRRPQAADYAADITDGPDSAGQVIAEDRVRRLLRQLPEAQAQVFFLRVFEDLPLAGIAGIMGISEGSVKVSLFRAKRKLREIIEEERNQ